MNTTNEIDTPPQYRAWIISNVVEDKLDRTQMLIDSTHSITMSLDELKNNLTTYVFGIPVIKYMRKNNIDNITIGEVAGDGPGCAYLPDGMVWYGWRMAVAGTLEPWDRTRYLGQMRFMRLGIRRDL